MVNRTRTNITRLKPSSDKELLRLFLEEILAQDAKGHGRNASHRFQIISIPFIGTWLIARGGAPRQPSPVADHDVRRRRTTRPTRWPDLQSSPRRTNAERLDSEKEIRPGDVPRIDHILNTNVQDPRSITLIENRGILSNNSAAVSNNPNTGHSHGHRPRILRLGNRRDQSGGQHRQTRQNGRTRPRPRTEPAPLRLEDHDHHHPLTAPRPRRPPPAHASVRTSGQPAANPNGWRSRRRGPPKQRADHPRTRKTVLS